jgi:large subunit ribosomal protein L18
MRANSIGVIVIRCSRPMGRCLPLFDWGSYLYHGRVKALADAAREGGLNF